MLKQYSNINEILTAEQSLSAQRLQPQDRNVLLYPPNRIDFNPALYPNPNQKIEMHVYANDSWITGNHAIQATNAQPIFINTETNTNIQFNAPVLNVNALQEFEFLGLSAGTYRIVLNFFENLIGSYTEQHLKIDEISPDRTEIRLKAIDTTNLDFLQQITNYIQSVKQTSDQGNAKTYLLNFSRNQCVQYVNSVVIGEFLYVKLLEPLSDDIIENFKCWVVCEKKLPYVDKIVIYPEFVERQFNQLSGPNWQANNKAYNISSETDLKTWNDLLGSSLQTSQEIIDSYFSGSLSGVKLNIDYTDFNNFVFYSSATERLANFKYKLELLESYTEQSASLSQLSGSVAVTNAVDYRTTRERLIGGFDDFEKFLYYQSSSGLFTHPGPIINPTVYAVTGSYITPVPKTNSTYPYVLHNVTSSAFQSWYNQLHATASIYDSDNRNILRESIPEYILLDQNNIDLKVFIDMLGQHFDILYTYVKSMTDIHNRDENPGVGMPNELLYSVAKQFGWTLTNGNQFKNLWEYVLGTNESGIPVTGSNSVGEPALPGRDMTYHVWRRIVNNIPGLLKSKGTKRSVQALLACYGVPQSLITIKEYGGPRIQRAPIYEKLNFDYALDLIRNPAGTVLVNYDQPIQTVELRFRTDNVLTNPTMSSGMNLFTIGSNTVTVDFSKGTLGRLAINGNTTDEIECYNGDWINTILRVSGSNLELIAKKSKYGKIIATVTASDAASFASSGTLTLGGTTSGDRLEGQLQELRLWTSSLDIEPFENHTKAPSAYDGNVDAYNEQVFRTPLSQKIDHALTSSLQGVEPNPSGISASFAGWTNDEPYDSLEETYYFDGISLGAGTFDDNKIRIESNELVGTLDINTRAERSQFDKDPLDSKKLGVYYSPQTMINEDIIAQLGFQSLDEYIGDPGDQDKRSYPDLKRVATDYWKKYSQKNDINSYIKIFSLFDLSFFRQLEQVLPARADKITGLLVQPNILERNKDTALPDVVKSNETRDTTLTIFDNTEEYVNATYDQYVGSINKPVATMSGNDDDQYQAYLTSSAEERYTGTKYCYDYVQRSGSTWVARTSPYWMCEGVLPTITGSRLSSFKQILVSISSSISYASGSGASYGTGSYGFGSYGGATGTSGSTTTYFYNYKFAQVQDYLPAGIDDLKYDGCKLNGPDFNINSNQTIDGGPVVEFTDVNPNQIIVQSRAGAPVRPTQDSGILRSF